MSKLMIIPLFDTVILPDVDYQLNIEGLSEEEKSRIKIDGNRAILLPLREGREKNQIVSEDFYPLGVMMDVIQISKTAMGTVLQGHSREKVSVTGIATESGLLEGNATPVDEIMLSSLFGIAVIALPAGIVTAGFVNEINADTAEQATDDAEDMLPYVDTAYITKIDCAYDADAYFPNLDQDPEWEMESESEEDTFFDLIYTFAVYRRKK